jgi:flagellar hook-length control protein FliK
MISAGTSASDARSTPAEMNARTAADSSARNTAADNDARNVASDVGKSGAASDSSSPAAVQLGSKGRKAAAKGEAADSAASARKGPTSFVHILAAKLAGKNHEAPSKELLAAEKPGAVSKAAEGTTKKLVLKLSAAHSTEEKKTLPGAEEAEGKKKPLRAPAGAAHAVVQVAWTPLAGQPGQPLLRSEKAAQTKETVTAAGGTHGAHSGVPAAQTEQAAPRIHVVDLRRKAEPGKVAEDAAALLRNQQGPSADKDGSSPVSTRPVTFQDASGILSLKQPAPVVPAGQTALERFREMAGNELVKATNMVLRDGGGEIRLVLKPESLGSVRIKMHLLDNHIEGRIVVDNQAVKQVIDGNLDALMRAFRAEGFQGATIQVSVGGQNADNGRQARDERPEAVRRVSAQGFERNIPGVENLSMGDLLVNLFV